MAELEKAKIVKECLKSSGKSIELTDKERMDFLCNLPICTIKKIHSTARGNHYPWKMHIINEKESYEFDDLRELIDWCMEKFPYRIPRKNKIDD